MCVLLTHGTVRTIAAVGIRCVVCGSEPPSLEGCQFSWLRLIGGLSWYALGMERSVVCVRV
jgi:hypothetical protein